MRFFLLSLFLALTSAGPKAKGRDQTAPTTSPTAAPPTPAVATAPTPEMMILDLKEVGTRLFHLIEANDFVNASLLFAIGMKYITNGKTYDLDLSMPAAIKSIPKRNRTELVWTYSDLDDYEIWGHAMTAYATGAFDPEFIRIHFNRYGLIDIFSHITPKPAQCTAMVKDVVKLALMRPDGSIVDAPQDQLQKMMAQQEAAKAAAAAQAGNSNSTKPSNSTGGSAASGLYASKPTVNVTSPTSSSNTSSSSSSTAAKNATKP